MRKKIKKNEEEDILMDDIIMEKCIDMILRFVPKLVFMEENGYAVPKTFSLLASWCPEKFY
jgi:hypothetical protein